jgi:glycosyltransferase involved in cell wall biosynthesis
MQTPVRNLPQDTLLLIPAFNEEESLPITIKALTGFVESKNILIVSDGSRDRTVQIARQSGVNVLELHSNVGVGGAVRAGMRYALRHGFDNVIQFDADLQHDPVHLIAIREKLESCDVVVGSRFLGSNNYEMSFTRRFASKVLSRAVSRRVETQLTDVTSGYRGAGPKAVKIFQWDYPSQYLADTVESLVVAHDKGLNICELPTPMNKRIAGSPSHGIWKSTLHLIRVALVLISTFQFRASKLREREK